MHTLYVQAAHTNISKSFAFHVHICIHIGPMHVLSGANWTSLHMAYPGVLSALPRLLSVLVLILYLVLSSTTYIYFVSVLSLSRETGFNDTERIP